MSSPYAQVGLVPLAAIGAAAYFTVFSLAIPGAFGYRFAIRLLKIVVALMFSDDVLAALPASFRHPTFFSILLAVGVGYDGSDRIEC